MRIKIAGLLVLVFITLHTSWGWAGTPQAEWQYYKDVSVTEGGFTLIQFDPQIMSNCQATFADLRITDQQGKELPSQVIQPGQQVIVSQVSLINSVEYSDYTSTVIDLGANPKSHNLIELNVKVGEDYLREVKLEASADAVKWGNLSNSKIFSYGGEQSNQIAYPTTNMRYLRVNISYKSGEKPLPVKSAQVKFLPTNIYESKLLDTKIISQRADKETTLITLDLGVPNYIITGIQIKTSDRNFNRRVNCFTTDNDSSLNAGEVLLKSEQILDYEWKNYYSVKDSMEINKFARRYLVLSILNGNSPVLNISDIKVYGCAPVLMADLQAPSRLWYGNPKALRPNYDLSEYANLINSRDLPVTLVGAQQLNPDYQPPVIPWTEKNKWLLDAVIVLVAAAFTVYILRKFKQLKAGEDENEEV
jgi:hypothetical protein